MVTGEIYQTSDRNRQDQNTRNRDEAFTLSRTGRQALADDRCEQANVERDEATDELFIVQLKLQEGEMRVAKLSMASRYDQAWQITGDFSPETESAADVRNLST